MKLPVAARDLLRTELKSHPEVEGHVPSLAHIDRMQKRELLTLATQLGVDVRKLVKQTRKTHSGLEGTFEKEEIDRLRYSEENPGFEGVLEFDLQLTMLGKEVRRKARIVWDYTPEWRHFDLKQQRVIKSCPGHGMYIEVLAILEGEVWETGTDGKLHQRDNSPVWTRIDLFEDGVIPQEIFADIEDRIDQKCKQEDALRRAHRSRSPDPPKNIQ